MKKIICKEVIILIISLIALTIAAVSLSKSLNLLIDKENE